MLAHSIPFAPASDAQAFAQVPASCGVLLLRTTGEGSEPYITKTANLRQRAKRLLGVAEEQGVSKRLNLRDRCSAIEFTQSGSEFESVVLLYHIFRQVYPKTYAKRMRFNFSPLIRIHWENAYPRAYITRKLTRPAAKIAQPSVYYGPFRSRSLAESFLNGVLDMFKSRRCTFELHPDPAFPGCVYSEMKMCLAPCFKGCSDDEYLAEMRHVQEFLDTRGESLISLLAGQREKASADLEFESAAALHTKIEKIKGVLRSSDEIVRRIDQLDAVIIQPAARDQVPNEIAEAEQNGPSVALFRFAEGQILGPIIFPLTGMMLANEASGSSSLYAQPFMPQAQPDVVVGKTSGDDLSARQLGPETRLAQAIESFAPKHRTPALGYMEQLAILKRWYYRSNRVGEIFFRNFEGTTIVDQAWPLRRILRGASRVFVQAAALARPNALPEGALSPELPPVEK